MLPFSAIAFAVSLLAAFSWQDKASERPGENYGGKGGKKKGKKDGKKRHRKDRGGSSEDSSEGEGEGGEEGADPLQSAMDQIDLEFELDQIGDTAGDDLFLDEFGVFPGPPTGADVLRSAGLAQPGSWTERNVLAKGAHDAWSRRVSGTDTEADYAILRAARPGIASSASGPISPAWTKAPWPGIGGSDSSSDIGDAVASEMGLGSLEDEEDED